MSDDSQTPDSGVLKLAGWPRWDRVALIVLTITLCFLAQAPPFGALILFLAGTIVPMWVIMTIVYADGDRRLFAVGAAVPSLIMLSQAIVILVYSTFEEWTDAARYLKKGTSITVPLMILLIPISGWLAILTRRSVDWLRPDANHEQREKRPFQFSLRSMIIGTTLVALACAVAALPPFLSSIFFLGLMFLFVLMAAILFYLSVTGELDGGSSWRIFAVGASIPMLMMVSIVVSTLVVGMFDDWNFIDDRDYNVGVKIALLLLSTFSYGGGRLALIMHERLNRNS